MGETTHSVEDRQRMVTVALSLIAQGRSTKSISASLKVSRTALESWISAHAAGGTEALALARPTGRPPLAVPTAEDVVALKREYLKTNRCRERGSKTLAARVLAKQGALTTEVSEAILKPRASKHTLTKTIRDAMHVSPALVRMHRSPRNARLAGPYSPGSLRMARETGAEGPRRLRAGERQSWDDGSINFCVCVPWPWGGDKCSDKYGVRVGRFQLLAGIDDASDFCPARTFVIRPLSSYRKEDVGAALFRTMRDAYRPDMLMLEGGSWQSHLVKRFLDAVGVKLEDAKGRPHSKLVENYWNRLWSVLSTVDGQIGRYRGEMERENALWIKSREGTFDPRQEFPLLDNALDALDDGLLYLNQEPVESKIYGTWVPAERHAADLAEYPREALDPEFAWMVAPIQEERVTRRGLVAVRAPSPFGEAFPYHFAAEELSEIEGQRVRVYFDPHDDPMTATVTLVNAFGGLPAGHVVTRRAVCLNDAPTIAARAEGDATLLIDEGGLARSIEMRKAINRAVRTEYKALGFGKRLPRKTSEIRGPDGSRIRAESGAGVADGATVEITGGMASLAIADTAAAAAPARKVRSRMQMLTE